MKKRILSIILIICMMLSTAGCGFVLRALQARADRERENASSSQEASGQSGSGEGESKTQEGSGSSGVTLASRPALLGAEDEILYDPDLVPAVPSYQVNSDFSNVVYSEKFAYYFDSSVSYYDPYNDRVKEQLIKDGFAVTNSSFDEFFDLYEDNRYMQFPNFITVDSLMHTYHLYFAYLMKNTEKDYLSGLLKQLSAEMLEASAKQYEQLKGTDWEKAALRNVAFFYIGSKLLDEKVQSPITAQGFEEAVDEELKNIYAAAGIGTSLVTEDYEDYSQYKPRGYYEGDPELEKYFRAMMWYGRIAFETREEDTLRSALLMTSAIDTAGQDKWKSIYMVTSFFAGASDDPGYYEFSAAAEKIYGSVPDVDTMVSDEKSFKDFADEVAKLELPSVNSIPVWEDENPVIPSFRFMGQRGTVDAAIMQSLVFKAVKENPAGQKRMLPDTLDVAAALGSGKAYEILKEQGATEFKNYDEHLKLAGNHFDNQDMTIWNASLYAGWLNTLRPLLKEKGEGYPSYMQSENWAKKDLETFAGSYAELKHDTILYAKQVMAEMGSGDDEMIVDDRGYVDPEPVVYSRFAVLAEKTKNGLQGFGMISEESAQDLDTLYQIAYQLLQISEKELRNEGLTEEEYEFIRCYGGYIEHFWREANEDNVDGLSYSYQAPCPVIADIATDPNGSVLEVGTGTAQKMFVIFPIDGELHVGSGTVYSFYQFTQPMSDRLTDSEWRERLAGGHLDDNWNWVPNDDRPTQPDWTQSYRVPYAE